MKKHFYLKILLSSLLLFIIYKLVIYFILDSRITYDISKPKIKLSQFISIYEKRVKYNRSYYIDKDFIGFNAYIDNYYFLTVTKLGSFNADYKIVNTNKKSENNGKAIGFAPSDGEEKTGRYIDIELYPFNKINYIYYYVDGKILKINQSKFYEVENTCSFFNISSRRETAGDFGFIGSNEKNSVSFIEYEGNLYVFNLFSLGKVPFKSLHTLLEMK